MTPTAEGERFALFAGDCREVLERHWPNAKRYEDVRDCGSHNLEAVDLICGGFPCQDISRQGKQAGIHAERSGLWWEMLRIIGELRPRYVLTENTSDLLARSEWIGAVVGSLAQIGYCVEWTLLSANECGAAHLRPRAFVVAHTHRA